MTIIRNHLLALFFTFFLVLGLFPQKALAQFPGWPGEGGPPAWTLFDTDNDGGDENGCADHRDVVELYIAADADYLYLRMQTVGDAGWPSAANGSPNEARYKWFFDVDQGGAEINGTNAFHVEYLLMVEDRLDNTGLPGTVDETRDALGEVYLLESSFDPNAPSPQGDFSEVWTVPEPDPYIQVGGLPGSNTYDWIREFDADAGTPGLGGPQGVEGTDIGYRITGDYVDMYVSWQALGNPDGVCLLWATDAHVPNLDQTPNCDRVSHPIDSCADAVQRTATLTIIKNAPDATLFGFTTGNLEPIVL